MKKNILLAIGILSALVCGGTVVANAIEETNEATTYILGDVDMNKQIDSTDYLRIKGNFLGQYELKGTEFAMADVNFDGVIDSSDYLSIKKTLLKEMTLDDSAWESQEGKAQGVYKDFGVYEDPTLYECPDGHNVQIGEGNVFYEEFVDYGESNCVDAENMWYEVYPAESVTYSDENGEKYTLEHGKVNVYNNGCALNEYRTTVREDGLVYDVTYYTDYKGEFCGYGNAKYIGWSYIENSDKEFVTEDEIVSIAKKKMSENLNGKIYKLEDVIPSQPVNGRVHSYRIIFRRYVNEIRTDEYTQIQINCFGELWRYVEFRSQLSEYDTRSFNVNDDKAFYEAKITDLLKKMVINDNEKFEGYISFGKLSEETLDFEIEEPVFFYAPDGGLAGMSNVKIIDKATGKSIYSKTLGFYATERLSASKQ